MPKVIRSDGTVRVRLISPGQGSTGYYSPELLKASAPKFAEAQVYWDHPSSSEEQDRPERSLRDLAGKIVGTPTWEESGKDGSGIYGDVQVFKPFRDAVEELAPHIGMSIRAAGMARMATVGGKSVKNVESISKVQSVDFVTLPGRGGKILQLFEAARPSRDTNLHESGDIDMADAAVLQQLQESNARTLQRLAIADARLMLVKEFAQIKLPKATIERLTESLVARAPIKDGELDPAAFKVLIEAQVKDEAAYLKEVTGGVHVTGMGAAAAPAVLTAEQIAESDKALRRELDESASLYGINTPMGKRIFNEGRSAFNPNYNSAERRHGVLTGVDAED